MWLYVFVFWREWNMWWDLEVHPCFVPAVTTTHSHRSVLTHKHALPEPINNDSYWSSLKILFHVGAWLFWAGGAGCGWWVLRALWQGDKLKKTNFYMRLSSGRPCLLSIDGAPPLKCADRRLRGDILRNELLVPEGRAGEIRLIWTLWLWLIFVMRSYSVVTVQTWKNRWLWIMVPPLSACPSTPLIVLSKALQPSPGLQHTG